MIYLYSDSFFFFFCFLFGMKWATSAIPFCHDRLPHRKPKATRPTQCTLASLKLWATIYPSVTQRAFWGVSCHTERKLSLTAISIRNHHSAHWLWKSPCGKSNTYLSISTWYVLCLGWAFGWATVRVALSGSWLLKASQLPLSLIGTSTFDGLKLCSSRWPYSTKATDSLATQESVNEAPCGHIWGSFSVILKPPCFLVTRLRTVQASATLYLNLQIMQIDYRF